MKTAKKLISVDDVMASLPEEERQKVLARGEELFKKIQLRMNLAEMRKQRKITQTQLAKTLGIDQVQVSRLERRKDPRLSTIQRTVASMGGHLTMIATFPDQEPVVLIASSGGERRGKERLSAEPRATSRRAMSATADSPSASLRGMTNKKRLSSLA